MYNYIFKCKYKLDAPRSLNRSPGKTTPYDPNAKCNFHRWVFWTLRVCIWNMHLGNIYAYNMRIRSTPKRIFRMSQDFHHWWNYFFWRKVFSKRFAPLYFFFNPLYSFTFLVWDGLNNAFDYWPIVVDDTCKYGVFEEVRIKV
jgi:hypothetical protein